MDITAIIGVGIIGTILSVTVKNYRPEIGVGVSLITGTIIFFAIASSLESVFSGLYSMCENLGVKSEFFKVTIKMIAISYITQFASQLAKDSGEGAIAKKVELAGKATVVASMIPIIKNLLDVIVNALMSF